MQPSEHSMLAGLHKHHENIVFYAIYKPKLDCQQNTAKNNLPTYGN